MKDLGTIAAIVSAVSALLVLYFSRRDKRFDELGKRIDEVRQSINDVEARTSRRIDEGKDEVRSLREEMAFFRKEVMEELRSFRLEFRNTIHDIEADTIDLDKRLIVLETVREEGKRPLLPRSSEEPRIIQRRARRRPKE